MGADRGQAAVEAALTLPLVLFLALAVLQLTMLLQARLLAQYAVFKATRAGALHHGECEPMADAALGALLPSFYAFTGGSSPDRPARKFADAFRAFKSAGYRFTAPQVGTFDGPVFWLRRDRPDLAELNARGPQAQLAGEDVDFDDPDLALMRMEVTLIYWYPMRIPFASWVLSRMAQAHFGIQDYAAVSPLLPTSSRPWRGTARLDSRLATELGARAAQRQYVFPIPVSYTMRMMTPARFVHFRSGPYCGSAP